MSEHQFQSIYRLGYGDAMAEADRKKSWPKTALLLLVVALLAFLAGRASMKSRIASAFEAGVEAGMTEKSIHWEEWRRQNDPGMSLNCHPRNAVAAQWPGGRVAFKGETDTAECRRDAKRTDIPRVKPDWVFVPRRRASRRGENAAAKGRGVAQGGRYSGRRTRPRRGARTYGHPMSFSPQP